MKGIILVNIVLLMLSCGGDQFDQKSINFMAEEVKAEVNKLSIPCGLHEKVKIANVQSIRLNKITDDNAEIEKFKKHTLMIDDQKVDIIINKATKDGFQFKYSTDITEYSLDSKPTVTRDEGTVWMYCDDYKKHNTPKKGEPAQPTGVMITVE